MAVENVDEKNTQSAWKVNSYVLETSGVLIFLHLSLFAAAPSEPDVIISGSER